MFVMPIARGDGFMTLMLQHTVSSSNVVDLCCTRQFSHTSFAQNNTCMITDLDSYRRLQHLAPPMLYLTHYEELAEAPNTRLRRPTMRLMDLTTWQEKDVALMRGDVDLEKMTQIEAKLVSSLLHTYYLIDDKYHLVQTFNQRPQDFSFDALLKDLQLLEANRSKDDDKAEYMDWKEDELDRREQYDREVEMGNRPQHSGATPWNPKLDEKGKPIANTSKARLKELWKM